MSRPYTRGSMTSTLEAKNLLFQHNRHLFTSTVRRVFFSTYTKVPRELFVQQMEILFLQNDFQISMDRFPCIFTICNTYHASDIQRYSLLQKIEFEEEISNESNNHDMHDYYLEHYYHDVLPMYRRDLSMLQGLLGSTAYNPYGREITCQESAIQVLESCRFDHGFTLYGSTMNVLVSTLEATWNNYTFVKHLTESWEFEIHVDEMIQSMVLPPLIHDFVFNAIYSKLYNPYEQSLFSGPNCPVYQTLCKYARGEVEKHHNVRTRYIRNRLCLYYNGCQCNDSH